MTKGGSVEVMLVIRSGEKMTLVRKSFQHGISRTSVWRRNGQPLTVQHYRDGQPVTLPVPERRDVLAWGTSEARLLLAEPTP